MIFFGDNIMWEFIKYCFYCMGITISAAFGYNPSGLLWKTGIIGVLTIIVLLVLTICIIYLLFFIKRKINSKMITIIIILFVLIVVSTVFFVLDAPVADQATDQISEYGEVNCFVSKSLKNDFQGILPQTLSEKEYPLHYSYHYQCAVFGDPRFDIQLQCYYENIDDFDAEEQRIRSLTDGSYYFDGGNEYLLISGSEQEISAVLDDTPRDGVKYTFEIACISRENRTIEYFVAYQWDGALFNENVVAFLSRVNHSISG